MSLASKVQEFEGRINELEAELQAITEAAGGNAIEAIETMKAEIEQSATLSAQVAEMQEKAEQTEAALNASTAVATELREQIETLSKENVELKAANADYERKIADPAYRMAGIEGQDAPQDSVSGENSIAQQWAAVRGTAKEFEFFRNNKTEIQQLAKK